HHNARANRRRSREYDNDSQAVVTNDSTRSDRRAGPAPFAPALSSYFPVPIAWMSRRALVRKRKTKRSMHKARRQAIAGISSFPSESVWSPSLRPGFSCVGKQCELDEERTKVAWLSCKFRMAILRLIRSLPGSTIRFCARGKAWWGRFQGRGGQAH